ncbi:hypothetical protein ACOSP7_023969 [Xanthoceras sorbifolium]
MSMDPFQSGHNPLLCPTLSTTNLPTDHCFIDVEIVSHTGLAEDIAEVISVLGGLGVTGRARCGSSDKCELESLTGSILNVEDVPLPQLQLLDQKHGSSQFALE